MQRLVGTRVLAALLTAAGCSGGMPAASTPVDEQQPGSPTHTVETPSPTLSAPTTGTATPLTVTISSTLEFSEDEPRAAEATVPFDQGGSVSATAADGTTFELVVPPQAMAEDTLIRLTPLTDVKGVGDGAVHAVRLEPEGLQFADWPRLTITPASPIPIARQVMFQATGTGEEVMAALVDPASEPIVILLPHFTIAGAAFAEAQGVWLAERALLPLKQLAHQVGRHLQRQQFRESQGADTDVGELGPYFDAAADALRAPDMNAATLMSCEATRIYMKALVDLERQRQYVGLSTDDTEAATAAEVRRADDASFKVCERLKINECRTKPDPAVLVAFWISWDRHLQLAFRDETPFAITEDMFERAGSICRETYQFEFSGSGTAVTFGQPVPITWHYWGLLCPDAHQWKVWEVFDGVQQSTNVPPTAPQGPILITFDGSGRISSSMWPPIGPVPGTMQGTDLILAPGDPPTQVTATINEGDGPPLTVTAPIEPAGDLLAECEEIE